MSMAHGLVTIDDDGSEHVTQPGMAAAIYDALKLIYQDTRHAFPTGDRGRDAKRDMAIVANRLGEALVTYLQANAVVKVDAGGLQQVRWTTTMPPTDTLPPSTAKTLLVE